MVLHRSGRRDAAVQWRTAAVAPGSISYPYRARHLPFPESPRGDGVSRRLMNRVRRRWEVSAPDDVAVSGRR